MVLIRAISLFLLLLVAALTFSPEADATCRGHGGAAAEDLWGPPGALAWSDAPVRGARSDHLAFLNSEA